MRALLRRMEEAMAPGSLDAVAVLLVRGAEVRAREVDFTMGGHHYRYPFIPEGEVWIDDAVSDGPDRAATVAHELAERTLMKHLGWAYDRAHTAANALERAVRRDA